MPTMKKNIIFLFKTAVNFFLKYLMGSLKHYQWITNVVL